jgi:hypothetical protein
VKAKGVRGRLKPRKKKEIVSVALVVKEEGQSQEKRRGEGIIII